MEARDIASITYELIRQRLDRCSMEYEDALSRSLRENLLLRRKYEHVKRVLVKQKDDYVELVQRVKEFTENRTAHPLGEKVQITSPSASRRDRERERDSVCVTSASPQRRKRAREREAVTADEIAREYMDSKREREKETTTTIVTKEMEREREKEKERKREKHRERERERQREKEKDKKETQQITSSHTEQEQGKQPAQQQQQKEEKEEKEKDNLPLAQTGTLAAAPQTSLSLSLDEWMEAEPSLPIIPAAYVPLPLPARRENRESKDDLVLNRSNTSLSSSSSTTNNNNNNNNLAIGKPHLPFSNASTTDNNNNNSYNVTAASSSSSSRRHIKRSHTTMPTSSHVNTHAQPQPNISELLFVKKVPAPSSTRKSFPAASTSGTTSTPAATATVATTASAGKKAIHKQPSMIAWIRDTENMARPIAPSPMLAPSSSSSSSSSTAVAGDAAHAAAENVERGRYQPKYIEVVRKKDQRAALRGHACEECAQFYQAMQQQGIVTPENAHEFMQNCSRHKARWTPPSTPDGFWDLTIRTPDQWKENGDA